MVCRFRYYHWSDNYIFIGYHYGSSQERKRTGSKL